MLLIAEFVTALKPLNELAQSILGGVFKFKDRKIEERKRVAELLDKIVEELNGILSMLKDRKIDDRGYGAISAYQERTPELLELVADKELADEIGLTLSTIVAAKHTALDSMLGLTNGCEDDLNKVEIEIAAVESLIRGAAGTISASANVLRAM